jgi:electron transfer flavoprotein alpha subunit
MHHVGGIKDARRIVAVNIDPKAPIFPNADEGFVADLRDLLPRLIQKVQSVTGGAA